MPEPVAKTIHELRSAIRKKLEEASKNRTVRSIARETGISATHLHNFKDDKRNLGFENLDILAAHLKIKYTLKNH